MKKNVSCKNHKNRIVFISFLILTCSLFISACGRKVSEESFEQYLTDTNNSKYYTMPSGIELFISNIDIDKKSQNIIVNVGINEDDDIYNWICQTVEDRKSDLNNFGNTVQEYLQKNISSQNYNLYIQIILLYGGSSIVYDYNSDILWIPDFEDEYKQKYEETGNFKKIENSNYKYYYVTIINGEFKELLKEYSNAY